MQVNLDVLRNFLKINRAFWKKNGATDVDKKNGEICVLHGIWAKMVNSRVNEDIIAKNFQLEKKMPIISLVFGKDALLEQIDKSFGIKTYNLYDINLPLKRRVLCFAKAARFILCRKGRHLVKCKCRGIRIGDFLYDVIQRRRGDVFRIFDVDSLTFKMDFVKLYRSLTIAERSFLFYRQHNIKYLISRTEQNEPGIADAMILSLGASFVDSTPWGVKTIPIIPYRKDIVEESKFTNVEKAVLEKHINRVTNQDLDSVNDSFLYKFGTSSCQSKDIILNRIGIYNDLPIALILPHCITDSCRGASTRGEFIDYNEWLVKTLEYASKNTRVNWILKEHPHAKAYGQNEYVRSLFDKYSNNDSNLFWLDNDIPGSELLKIADVVLTDTGDVGCEYVAEGIQSVYTGKSYYQPFGIGIYAGSKDRYFECLKKAEWRKVDKKHQLMAKRIICFKKNRRKYLGSTDLCELNDLYENRRDSRLMEGKGWSVETSSYLRDVSRIIEKDEIDCLRYDFEIV